MPPLFVSILLFTAAIMLLLLLVHRICKNG